MAGAKAILVGMLGVLLLAGSVVADRFDYHYPHNWSTSTACESCHYMVQEAPPAWVSSATPYDTLCLSCHNEVIQPNLTVQTHSSANTSSRYGDWAVECRTCHWPHHQRQYQVYGATVATGVSTGLSASPPDEAHPYGTGTLTVADAGWAEDQFNDFILVPNTAHPTYNARILDTTSDTLLVSPAIDLAYTAVGDPFAIFYGKLIKDQIRTPNSGRQTVRFFNTTGPNSYADGDASSDGVCEVCHTRTTHFRNDGSAPDQLHSNVGGGQAGRNCVACHAHANGFAHGGGAGGGGCESCHGHDGGFGGPGSGGKGSFFSHSTHTESDADDAKGPALACGDCHNTSAFPSFKDGAASLAVTTVCDPCHSPGGTYDGVGDPEVGAKANWDAGIYAADGVSLKPGKEKWCATCHDEEPSVIQGVSAPHVIGDEDGAYTYGTGWGFYKTGHGLPAAQAYPSKGGQFPPLMVNGSSRAVECGSCHDLASRHIDGVARTYGTQAVTPTGYRQGYRLKMIDGKEPMEVPKTPWGENTFDDYLLCFQCHDSTPFLDPVDERSNMAQRSTGNASLKVGHYYHLASIGWQGWRSDWRSTVNSGVSCTQCHNVHGSKAYAMLSDGSLTGTAPGLEFFYYNRALSTRDPNAYNPPVPRSLPLGLADGFQWLPLSTNRVGCSATCHGQTLYRTFEWTPYNVPNQAPLLAWTGEANYTAASVYPTSAVSGSSFEFRVKYLDHLLDMNGAGFDNAPSYIRVLLDTDNDGGFETAYSMDYVGPAAGEGRIYRKVLPIRNTFSNTIPYKIVAGDGPDTVSTGSAPSGLAAEGAPTEVRTLELINRPPVLSWTNETHFEADGVNPDAGGAGRTFSFRVSYTDPDNNPPDANGVRVVINGIEYAMEEKEAFYYDTGRHFARTVTLEAAGDLAYRFVAQDLFGAPASGEPTAEHLVQVQAATTPPVLDWVVEEGRTAGVKPAVGLAGEAFDFRIRYTDAGNQWPPSAGSMEVWVDQNDNGLVDAGETLEMDEEVAGAGAVAGKLYRRQVRLTSVGDGSIRYRFLASNGADLAVGEPTADQELTILRSTIWTTDADFNAGALAGLSVLGAAEPAFVTLAPGPENWRQLSVTGQPPGSSSGPLVYDSRCQKLVYYDGQTSELDPALGQWTRITTAAAPPTNYANWGWAGSANMTYDPRRDRVVLLDYTGATWEYHAGLWTNRGAANINPLGQRRFKYALVYDTSIRQVVLVGGVNTPGVNYVGGVINYEETWTYDPVWNTWTPVLFHNTDPPAGKGFRNSKVSQTNAFYDEAANRLVIPAGHGYSYGAASTRTYAFSSADWLWSDLGLATPNRMYQIPLAYDSRQSRGILYGGTLDDQAQYQTWAFDSATAIWQQLSPANAPTFAAGSMAYDAEHRRLVLNGGASGTWTFGATYPTATGTITGLIADAGAGQTAQWHTLAWDAQVPAGTGVQLQVRTGNSEAELAAAAFQGPDGTGQTFFTASPSALSGLAACRFLEVEASLETSDPALSPTLRSITVGYDTQPE
ncbi:MAG: cytochrome c3 family protein [Thermodesulfobacteriota bacterium]